MSQPPTRPFESLDWYHDAARHGFQSDPRSGWSRWAAGWGMLRVHVSIFAIGVVVLYALNVFFDPGGRWAGWWILAWSALVGIHAIVVAMLWALRQWNDERADEPLFVPVRTTPGTWSLPPDQASVQDADFRSSGTTEPTQTWSPWQTPEPQPEVPESERASWSEAAPDAWLTRHKKPPTPPEQS